MIQSEQGGELYTWLKGTMLKDILEHQMAPAINHMLPIASTQNVHVQKQYASEYRMLVMGNREWTQG